MIRRFSSRRQRLDHSFLTNRLTDACAYDRIAGYFSSSILEVAGETLETVRGLIRIVCNSDLDMRDVETAKAANYAMRREWCASHPEQYPDKAKDRFARLYAFLRSGKMQVRVVPREQFGLVHGKAGVITLADGHKICFMGSANETYDAWKLHYELVWEDDAPDAVQWVQEEFDALWHSPFAVPLADFVVADVGRLAQRLGCSSHIDGRLFPCVRLRQSPGGGSAPRVERSPPGVAKPAQSAHVGPTPGTAASLVPRQPASACPSVARGFDDPRAQRQVLRPQGRSAPPMPRLANRRPGRMPGLAAWGARPQAPQRSQDCVDARGRIASPPTQRVCAFRVWGTALTRGCPQGAMALCHRRGLVEPCCPPRSHITARTPMVRRPIGHLAHAHSRPLDEGAPPLCRPWTLESPWVGLRHPGHPPCAQPPAVVVRRGEGGTPPCLGPHRAPGGLARRHRLPALRLTRPLCPGPHDPIEGHRHGHSGCRDGCLLAQGRFTRASLRLPRGAARLGQPLERPGGRRPVAEESQAFLPLVGGQMRPPQVACWAARGGQEPSILPARSSRGHTARSLPSLGRDRLRSARTGPAALVSVVSHRRTR